MPVTPWFLLLVLAPCLVAQDPPRDACTAKAVCQRWWALKEGFKHELKFRVELSPTTPTDRRHQGSLSALITFRYRESRETNHHRVFATWSSPKGQSFREFTATTICSSLPHDIMDVSVDRVECRE